MADNEAIVPQMAKLTITFAGQQGDLPDPVSYDASDADLKQMATESVRQGYVPGIDAAPNADFTDFVVDRFEARPDVPYRRLSLRPKTPFGILGGGYHCPKCGRRVDGYGSCPSCRMRCQACGYLQPKGSQRGDTCPSCDEAL
jgi:hypothetical protein